MSNWKIGWCVGEAIENIADSEIIVGNGWRPESITEINNHLSDVFRYLGNEDSDIVYMLFLLKKRQVDVCEILNKTQPAISYDIKRVKRQINFIYYLLSVVDEFLLFLSEEHGLTGQEVDILILIFFSTSFTKTSKLLGYHQITCRNKFRKILKTLDKNGYHNIREIFDNIQENLNKIKKNLYIPKD